MNIHAPHTLTSTVSYVTPSEEQLYMYNLVEPPAGKPACNQVFDNATVKLQNIRGQESDYKLDIQGFELISFAPKVDDIYDPNDIVTQYYPQITDLLKNKLGATEVRMSTPFLRGPEAQRRIPGSMSNPAHYVHVDFTLTTGPEYFDRMLGPMADELRGRRYAVINVWRPITGPLRDHPLALCDARTVQQSELVSTRHYSRSDSKGIRRPDGEITIGETYSVIGNPKHRWYYVSDMMPDEALLLKNYDSADNVSRFSPHTACKDPDAPADVLPRASIEVRTLVVW